METCLSPARMSFSGTSHAVTHLLEQAHVLGAVLPPWIYLGSVSTVLKLYLNMSTMHMKERHNEDHQKTRGKKIKDTSETKRVQEAIGSSRWESLTAEEYFLLIVIWSHCLKLDRGPTSCFYLLPLLYRLTLPSISSGNGIFSTQDWTWTGPSHNCPTLCPPPNKEAHSLQTPRRPQVHQLGIGLPILIHPKLMAQKKLL